MTQRRLAALPPLSALSAFSAPLLAAALFTLAGGAHAQVTVSNAWVRATVPGQQATGMFGTFTAKQDSTLVGASSPVAHTVEVHEMKMEGDVMRMRQLEDGLEVPAGGQVVLKPGSFDVMLMDLKQSLKAGDTVPLTLTFASAGTLETELVVKPAGAMAPGMDHGEKGKPHG